MFNNHVGKYERKLTCNTWVWQTQTTLRPTNSFIVLIGVFGVLPCWMPMLLWQCLKITGIPWMLEKAFVGFSGLLKWLQFLGGSFSGFFFPLFVHAWGGVCLMWYMPWIPCYCRYGKQSRYCCFAVNTHVHRSNNFQLAICSQVHTHEQKLIQDVL